MFFKNRLSRKELEAAYEEVAHQTRRLKGKNDALLKEKDELNARLADMALACKRLEKEIASMRVVMQADSSTILRLRSSVIELEEKLSATSENVSEPEQENEGTAE